MRIKKDTHHRIMIEKSEFICYLHRSSTEEDAREFIATIKKKHYNATHCCSAFVCGNHHETQRCSDDGEPSGTAGVPMLSALKAMDIHDCCACVVRYFGGVKLGTGGLIRAYSKAVSETLHQAQKVLLTPMNIYSITFSYDLIGKLDHGLQDFSEIIDKSYEVDVTYLLQSNDPDFTQKFTELTQGKIEATFIEERLVEKEID